MRPFAKVLPDLRRLLTVVLLAHLLAVLVLAASPRLHHWVHPDDAGRDDDCAVTLFLHSGTGTLAGPVPLLTCAGAVSWVVACFVEWVVFVPSVFSENRVLEHGPPLMG